MLKPPEEHPMRAVRQELADLRTKSKAKDTAGKFDESQNYGESRKSDRSSGTTRSSRRSFFGPIK